MYRQYFHDTFLVFGSTEYVEKFKNYLNKLHKNDSFTSEIEQYGSLSCLDTEIDRGNNNFATSVYQNCTFRSVFTNFESFFSKSYEPSPIDTLLYRVIRLCSCMEFFHQEISFMKSIFKSSGYPKNFKYSCIKYF